MVVFCASHGIYSVKIPLPCGGRLTRGGCRCVSCASHVPGPGENFCIFCASYAVLLDISVKTEESKIIYYLLESPADFGSNRFFSFPVFCKAAVWIFLKFLVCLQTAPSLKASSYRCLGAKIKKMFGEESFFWERVFPAGAAFFLSLCHLIIKTANETRQQH